MKYQDLALLSVLGLLLVPVLSFISTVNAQPSLTNITSTKNLGNLTQQILTRLIIDANKTGGNFKSIIQLEKKNNPHLDFAAINSTAKSFASFNSHKVPFVLSAMRATPGQVVGWAGAGAIVGGSILPGAGAAIGAAIGALGCALGLFC